MKVKKAISSIGFLLVMILIISGCQKKKRDNYLTFYQAVNGKDTAVLGIGKNKNRFFGNYQIFYNGRAVKDSGVVDGEIKGDTLRGKFKYRTYGGGVNIIPIIFLERNGTLISGKGIAASFMNLVYFMPEYPIEFENPDFVFKKVELIK